MMEDEIAVRRMSLPRAYYTAPSVDGMMIFSMASRPMKIRNKSSGFEHFEVWANRMGMKATPRI